MKDRNGHYHCDWDGASLASAGGPGPHFCSPECLAAYYADLGEMVPPRRCTRCKKPRDSLAHSSCSACRSHYARVYFGGEPADSLEPCNCGAPRTDRRSRRCSRCLDRRRRMRAVVRTRVMA